MVFTFLITLPGDGISAGIVEARDKTAAEGLLNKHFDQYVNCSGYSIDTIKPLVLTPDTIIEIYSH